MKDSNQAIFDNAIDFLEKSLEEFKDSPKYSILHFAIAVEILLKARLAIEHWSLVVQKNANKTNYLKGDFKSVNLDEAVKRLRDIVGEHVSEAEHQSFKKIAAHRNKVIHFYHGEINSDKESTQLQQIVKEQCECWYHLKTFFTKKWHTHFTDHLDHFNSLDWKMKQHWEYLSTVFEQKKPELEKHRKLGKIVGTCTYCSFESVPFEEYFPEISNGRCLVCEWVNTLLTLECECGQPIIFQNEPWQTCQFCNKKYEPEDVYALIYEFGYDGSEWPDCITPANCKNCDGYHTVAAMHDKYFCTSCFELFESVGECGWCNEYCTGNLEYSYYKGCAVCEGKMGWDGDN